MEKRLLGAKAALETLVTPSIRESVAANSKAVGRARDLERVSIAGY